MDNKSHTQEEISKMEKELSKMELNLCDSYCEVGKAVLETAEQESRKINNLVDEIVEMQQKLVALKGEKYCPACTEHNDQNSLYCKRCGHKLEDNEQDEKSS